MLFFEHGSEVAVCPIKIALYLLVLFISHLADIQLELLLVCINVLLGDCHDRRLMLEVYVEQLIILARVRAASNMSFGVRPHHCSSRQLLSQVWTLLTHDHRALIEASGIQTRQLAHRAYRLVPCATFRGADTGPGC